jgi:hypothetical protein
MLPNSLRPNSLAPWAESSNVKLCEGIPGSAHAAIDGNGKDAVQWSRRWARRATWWSGQAPAFVRRQQSPLSFLSVAPSCHAEKEVQPWHLPRVQLQRLKVLAELRHGDDGSGRVSLGGCDVNGSCVEGTSSRRASRRIPRRLSILGSSSSRGWTRGMKQWGKGDIAWEGRVKRIRSETGSGS